jgi:hypothetical protein
VEALVLAQFLDVRDARFVDGDAAGGFTEERNLSPLERLNDRVVVLLKGDGLFGSDEMDDCGHRDPFLIGSATDPSQVFRAVSDFGAEAEDPTGRTKRTYPMVMASPFKNSASNRVPTPVGPSVTFATGLAFGFHTGSRIMSTK